MIPPPPIIFSNVTCVVTFQYKSSLTWDRTTVCLARDLSEISSPTPYQCGHAIQLVNGGKNMFKYVT